MIPKPRPVKPPSPIRRDTAATAEQCAWDLARGLAKALVAVSRDGRGACWCNGRNGSGFHTVACTTAYVEYMAARMMMGDTLRRGPVRQANGATD